MNICVFGASSDKLDEAFYTAAEELGGLIAKSGNTLVFGGGKGGIMGKCAMGAAACGGHIIGIAPSFFDEPEILYKDSGELIFTETMDERKQLMNEKSDAFIVLPGGLGTFDEFFGCLTQKQLGRHSKAVVLLDTLGYFEPLCALIDHSIQMGFTGSDCHSLFAICKTPRQVMEYLGNYVPVCGNTKRICDYAK